MPESSQPLGRVVEDVYRDQGPLGGIHAALSTSPTELNLMLAVDLPFVDANFLRYLLSRAQGIGRDGNAAACSPRLAAAVRNLSACICCSRLKSHCATEETRSIRYSRKYETCVIDEEELVRGGFSLEMFRNLNTPDDLEKARSSHRERSTQ